MELSDGRIISFGKCLLATGCREARLPGIPPALKEHVTNLRKVKDFERVQARATCTPLVPALALRAARSGAARRGSGAGGGVSRPDSRR